MALTKCKECKKEVSSSAKLCPHCGVKDPSTTLGQTLGGLVVMGGLVWGAFHFFGGSDSKETEKPHSGPKVCATDDGQCIFDQNWIKASTPCRTLVEKSAKFDFEWTDGMLDPMFTHFRLDSVKRQITFIGDKVKFTNGFNAKSTVTYECVYDLNGNKLVDFNITKRKL